MIDVDQALNIISENCPVLPSVKISLKDSLQMVLSKDVISPINVPGFNQSAMDGYAFRFEDLQDNWEFAITGTVAAGGDFNKKVENGQCLAIYTGAGVPENADTIVIQENCQIEENKIQIIKPPESKGANIRKSGSQIKKGEVASFAGTKVSPGLIGYLSMLGITDVDVFSQPRIAIIVTGDELADPGQNISGSEVYECNSFTLISALNKVGISDVVKIRVKDDKAELKNQVLKNCQDRDVLIFSGGISVGRYDFVKPVLEELDYKCLFHKIKQKPGKPLYFGRKGKQLVFALPGNPGAALSCFYFYVYFGLDLLQGSKSAGMSEINLPLKGDYTTKGDKTLFVKGKMATDGVIPMEGQESYKMSSFAEADALIRLNPSESGLISSLTKVSVFIIP